MKTKNNNNRQFYEITYKYINICVFIYLYKYTIYIYVYHFLKQLSRYYEMCDDITNIPNKSSQQLEMYLHCVPGDFNFSFYSLAKVHSSPAGHFLFAFSISANLISYVNQYVYVYANVYKYKEIYIRV